MAAILECRYSKHTLKALFFSGPAAILEWLVISAAILERVAAILERLGTLGCNS